MSTRAQLEFVAARQRRTDDGDTETRTEKRRVYNHSDGYPDGIFPALQEFHGWLADEESGDRSFDGPEYVAANFLYFMKRQSRERLSEEVAKRGYGVCAPDRVHGDIEFFYRVELRPQQWVVKCWSVWDVSNDRIQDLIAADEPDEQIAIDHTGELADMRERQFADEVSAGGDA